MPVNSKKKGNRGELEWARRLRDLFGCSEARRGKQYKGTEDSPDVVDGIPGTHCEVKRVEKLNVTKALEKATDEARLGSVPYVAHRRNRERWQITIWADDLPRLCEAFAAIEGRE